METEEWHVVRHRKNRLRVSQKGSNGCIPKPSDEQSSTGLVKLVTASTDPASPRVRQEVEVVPREELVNGFRQQNWKPKQSATSVGGGRTKQREELLAKCRIATEKVRRSPFFQRFLEQLHELHRLTAASTFARLLSARDGYREDAGLSKREVGSSADRPFTGNHGDAMESETVVTEQHMQLVVYGIGSIEDSEVSRCQLSLALLLKETLSFIVSFQVYDPVVTPLECLVLGDLGCTPLEHNENGKMRFSVPTLFYMPHCEARLYDDVMKSNMHLVTSGCAVILGNSFRSYQNRWSLPFLGRTSFRPDLLLRLADIVDEHPLDTRAFPVQAAFNDTSWHFFHPGPCMSC